MNTLCSVEVLEIRLYCIESDDTFLFQTELCGKTRGFGNSLYLATEYVSILQGCSSEKLHWTNIFRLYIQH
jgi:hypothetical protein